MRWCSLLLLAACGEVAPTFDSPPGAAGDDAASFVPLPDALAARRVRMSLLGTPPTLAELDAVSASPLALDAHVDAWLTDPALDRLVREIYAELLLVRTTRVALPEVGELTRTTTRARQAAVSEEPLALIARVVTEGRPFTEVLTADWTVLSEVGGRMWAGHDRPDDAPGEVVARYTDGRPAAGVLSTNGLWTRHPSNGTNYGRGRANLLADAFLCADLLARDVTLAGDVDLADPDAVAAALRTDPACVSCHQTLDPLAAHTWPIYPVITRGSVFVSETTGCRAPRDLCYPIATWRPDYAYAVTLLGLRPPGYYGQESTDLGTLGAHIAADPRFATCTARRFAAYLRQDDVHDLPEASVARWADAFRDSGHDARALLRAIVTDPAFLAQAVTPDAPSTARERLAGPLLLRPWQADATFEALVGTRWASAVDGPLSPCGLVGATCYGEAPLLDDDVFGLRAIAGGIDGDRVTAPTFTPTPTRTLALAAMGEDAAGLIVQADRQGLPSAPGLVPTATLDEDARRAWIADLLRRTTADAPEATVTALDGLFAAAAAERGREDDGWRAVLAALLQLPSTTTY